MKNRLSQMLLVAILFSSSTLIAQVPVSKEPRHKNVLENKYIRLLDVTIAHGDTTLFHIHATPSVFVYFTNTIVCSQIKGKEWVTAKNTAGNASYRSFINDTVVHRVSNCDTVPFHVTDIEILSAYNSNILYRLLPFTVLFENEKVAAYRLTGLSFNNQTISSRGPIVAELVEGSDMLFHDIKNKKSTVLKTGEHLYIEPGRSFYFSTKEHQEINLVIFEIK